MGDMTKHQQHVSDVMEIKLNNAFNFLEVMEEKGEIKKGTAKKAREQAAKAAQKVIKSSWT